METGEIRYAGFRRSKLGFDTGAGNGSRTRLSALGRPHNTDILYPPTVVSDRAKCIGSAAFIKTPVIASGVRVKTRTQRSNPLPGQKISRPRHFLGKSGGIASSSDYFLLAMTDFCELRLCRTRRILYTSARLTHS